MSPTIAPWKKSDAVIGPFHGSRMSNMSTRCDILCLIGLRDDGDVGNAALLHDVHQLRERAKGNVLVTPQVNGMVLGVLYLVTKDAWQCRQLDRIAAEEDVLVAVHGQHQPRLDDFLHR